MRRAVLLSLSLVLLLGCVPPLADIPHTPVYDWDAMEATCGPIYGHDAVNEFVRSSLWFKNDGATLDDLKESIPEECGKMSGSDTQAACETCWSFVATEVYTRY